MPATVTINEKNGVGEVATDKTLGAIRYQSIDSAAVDLNNPIDIPAAGSVFSFQKYLRATAGGTFTQLSNARFYTGGAGDAFSAGIDTWVKAVAAYATPVQETDSATYADMFSYTSAAPLSLGAGPFTSLGEFGDYVVSAAEVSSTASSGVETAKTITFGWDEI